MTTGGPQETMTGLAKRWLKTQLTFHGDPIRSRREQQEAREIEARMHEKPREDAQRAVVEALIPPSWKRKMADWEDQAAERRDQQIADRQAEHAARPRARLTLALSGDINGETVTDVPVIVRVPVGEDTALVVELEPLDAVPVAGSQFLGLQFAIPSYRGTGEYDLLAMASVGDTWIETWDSLWFQSWFDTTDESFFWCPDYGSATATVDETARTISIELSMHDSGGRVIRLHSHLVLPFE